MPKNTLLFPPNFVFDTIGAESGISGLQIAVNNLAVASKSGAMRQAHALGVSGRNSIKNQNKGMPTLNSLLPTRSIGKYTVAPSIATGTLGYFIGGFGNTTLPTFPSTTRRIERFSFGGNTLVSLGDMINGLHQAFVASSTTNGYIAMISAFNRLSFSSESLTNVAASLFPNRYAVASLKTPSRAYACSGVISGSTFYSEIDRFSFAGEVCVSIGASGQVRSHNCGYGNKFSGYLAGGYNAANAPTNNIERFSYASEVKANITAGLQIVRAIISTWMPSSVAAAYLLGGASYGSFPTPPGSPAQSYFTNTIEKFVFVGETTTLLGVTLPNIRAFFGTVGNATRVITAGGYMNLDAYNIQSSVSNESTQVLGLTFATEITDILGTVLSQGRYALGGFDNSSF